MENYKADANLMIGDMMVTMTDDGDHNDVFISMLQTRKRFWEMRITWFASFHNERVILLRDRHLAPCPHACPPH